MKKQVWVVVANSSLSKIYQAHNVDTLAHVKTFEHVQSHLSGRDLTADKSGIGGDHWGGRMHAIEERIPPKTKEAVHFAKQIAGYLEEECQNGSCTAIYLIANPTFLGMLRQSLGNATTKLIKDEIHKDLTHMKPEQIREYLPPVL